MLFVKQYFRCKRKHIKGRKAFKIYKIPVYQLCFLLFTFKHVFPVVKQVARVIVNFKIL